jgi:hypothetical protein
MEITRDLASRVLDVVDAGLTNGLGLAIPGGMCVEAAVCYAMGLPHGDDPGCVNPILRFLKIYLNDSYWSSKKTRAMGMRRLAIAQLGTNSNFNSGDFTDLVLNFTIRVIVPIALRSLLKCSDLSSYWDRISDAADECELLGTKASAEKATILTSIFYNTPTFNSNYINVHDAASNAAYTVPYNAAGAVSVVNSAAREAASLAAEEYDKILNIFAEGIVQILIDMKTPGSEFLDLTNI